MEECLEWLHSGASPELVCSVSHMILDEGCRGCRLTGQSGGQACSEQNDISCSEHSDALYALASFL